MREMELVGANDGDEQQREEEHGLRSSLAAAELRRAIVETGADSAVVKAAGATRRDVDENDNRSDEAPLLATAAVAPNGMASNGTPATAGDSLEEMELKYAAYVRDDNYGALGRGALPLREKGMLLLAFLTIVPIRFVLLILVLLTYYIICRIFTLFRSPSDEEGQENYGYLRGMRRFIIVHSGRFLTRVMLFVLGFYWIKVTPTSAEIVQGAEPAPPQGYDSVGMMQMEDTQKAPGAIVSNHVSYLDILYHMSASFPSFVAKRSVAKLPLVGLISKCLGCIYVQRESKTSDTKGVSGIVAERLRAAHSEQGAQVMLLFPEGTTTNGEHLLPFKTGAFLSQTPVLPVILKYPHTRFSPAWESISGVRHILLLLCQPVNHLEVVRLPVYCPSAKEKADPKLYASNVRKLMAEAGGLTLSDIGLLEKRIYLNALKGKETAR